MGVYGPPFIIDAIESHFLLLALKFGPLRAIGEEAHIKTL
jgi:hypothetical protein